MSVTACNKKPKTYDIERKYSYHIEGKSNIHSQQGMKTCQYPNMLLFATNNNESVLEIVMRDWRV